MWSSGSGVRQGETECPPAFGKKRGKIGEKRKNREEKEKNREGSFILPLLLTDRAGYVTVQFNQGGDTPYTLARRFLSTHERRHVPSHVPFQQRHMTTHVTFFNMARPLWPNPSSAIAPGYVVSTHKRSDNLRCVKEIHELVIRKVSAQFSTWRGPSGRIHRVQ